MNNIEDILSHNVGASDYSKHNIQPWQIWEEYNLNPWDADIVKRVLRTKATDGRKLDYEKIIHICQYRIAQLEKQQQRKPPVTNSVKVDVQTPALANRCTLDIGEDSDVIDFVNNTLSMNEFVSPPQLMAFADILNKHGDIYVDGRGYDCVGYRKKQGRYLLFKLRPSYTKPDVSFRDDVLDELDTVFGGISKEGYYIYMTLQQFNALETRIK